MGESRSSIRPPISARTLASAAVSSGAWPSMSSWASRRRATSRGPSNHQLTHAVPRPPGRSRHQDSKLAIGPGERLAGLILFAEPPVGHRQDRRLEVVGIGYVPRQVVEGLAIAPGAIVGQAERNPSPGLGRIDGDALIGELDETIGADQRHWASCPPRRATS